jgi:hypothetical protein
MKKDPGSIITFLMSSAISEPGTFFGHMSVSAAHRSILMSNPSDLSISSNAKHRAPCARDFYAMRVKAIGEANKKLQDPAQATGEAALSIVLNLIRSAVGELVPSYFIKSL